MFKSLLEAKANQNILTMGWRTQVTAPIVTLFIGFDSQKVLRRFFLQYLLAFSNSLMKEFTKPSQSLANITGTPSRFKGLQGFSTEPSTRSFAPISPHPGKAFIDPLEGP